jgi:hypothetical protein
MHEDVTRISGFSVAIAVDEMLDSVNEDQLEEAYQNALDAVEAVYNSMIAKLEDV